MASSAVQSSSGSSMPPAAIVFLTLILNAF